MCGGGGYRSNAGVRDRRRPSRDWITGDDFLQVDLVAYMPFAGGVTSTFLNAVCPSISEKRSSLATRSQCLRFFFERVWVKTRGFYRQGMVHNQLCGYDRCSLFATAHRFFSEWRSRRRHGRQTQKRWCPRMSWVTTRAGTRGNPGLACVR